MTITGKIKKNEMRTISNEILKRLDGDIVDIKLIIKKYEAQK